MFKALKRMQEAKEAAEKSIVESTESAKQMHEKIQEARVVTYDFLHKLETQQT